MSIRKEETIRIVRFPKKIRSSIYSPKTRSPNQQKNKQPTPPKDYSFQRLTDREKLFSQKQNSNLNKNTNNTFSINFSKTHSNPRSNHNTQTILPEKNQLKKKTLKQKTQSTQYLNLQQDKEKYGNSQQKMRSQNDLYQSHKREQYEKKKKFLTQKYYSSPNKDLFKDSLTNPFFSKKSKTIRQSEILTFSEQIGEFVRTPPNNGHKQKKNENKIYTNYKVKKKYQDGYENDHYYNNDHDYNNGSDYENDSNYKCNSTNKHEVEFEVDYEKKNKETNSSNFEEETTNLSDFSRKSKAKEQPKLKNVQSKINNSSPLTPKKKTKAKSNDLIYHKQKSEQLLKINKSNLNVLKNKSENNIHSNNTINSNFKYHNKKNSNTSGGNSDRDIGNGNTRGGNSDRSMGGSNTRRGNSGSMGGSNISRGNSGRRSGSKDLRTKIQNNKSIQNNNKVDNRTSKQINSKKMKKEKSGESDLFQRKWKLGDFKFKKLIGEGQFGKVYLAQEKITKRYFAIKVLTTTKIRQSGGTKQLAREINVQSTLRHHNILKMYGYFYERNQFFLILEYAQGGELYKKLINSKKFTERQAANYITSLYSAVDYFHSKNVIHRDLKPENVLITQDGVLKISDFGFSVFTNPYNITRNTFCGTLDYLPPEMVVGNSYDLSVDKWSLGVLLYEFLVGAPPFETRNRLQTYKRIAKVRFTFPNHVSSLAQDLVKKMLKKNPIDRISFQEFLNHPWIKNNVDENKLKSLYLEH
ncbi:aurora a [Anaeramoeba flamelloides]|uniref:Aurora kinase n=1 Tax=Anaeramoeba flamelloides TaxID=1746091 RepID=A0AAV7Y8G8_9EUKA|nr:aurora a [Anaeramoeba flamelloides]